jgi:hypothetical protein
MLLGILGHIPDEDGATEIVSPLLRRLTPGSYLVVNDGTNAFHDQAGAEAAEDSARTRAIARYAETSGAPYHAA